MRRGPHHGVTLARSGAWAWCHSKPLCRA